GYAGKPPIDQHHGDNGADAKDNLKQQNEVNLRECKLNGRYVVVHPRQQVPMVRLLQESRPHPAQLVIKTLADIQHSQLDTALV
ncbi:hypothetical protein SB7C_12265, partial [Staphylococcus epidermidis]